MSPRHLSALLIGTASPVLAVLGYQWHDGRALSLWLLHTWVLVGLCLSWYFAVLQPAPDRRKPAGDDWTRSSHRRMLAYFTLPILLTVHLAYLKLAGFPFMASKTGRKFVTLTILGYFVCLWVYLRRSDRQDPGLLADGSAPHAAVTVGRRLLGLGMVVVGVVIALSGLFSGNGSSGADGLIGGFVVMLGLVVAVVGALLVQKDFLRSRSRR